MTHFPRKKYWFVLTEKKPIISLTEKNINNLNFYSVVVLGTPLKFIMLQHDHALHYLGLYMLWLDFDPL